jgi:uncharacterized protein (TIGR03435 family)
MFGQDMRNVAAAAVIVGALASAGLCAEQGATVGSDSRFEVASVRPTRDLTSGTWATTPGQFVRRNVRVKELIAFGFGMGEDRIMGPEKLLARRYDVVATTAPTRTAADLRTMVRNLLVDRFALRAHEESRELPVYYLTMSRPDRRLGPNLRPLKFDCEKDLEHPCSTTLGSDTQIIESGRDWNVIAIARRLRNAAGRIVVDKTGLTGPFDIRLEWSPTEVNAAGDSALRQNVSLFTALQEQLGLELEPGSAQVPILVIDDIREATEN